MPPAKRIRIKNKEYGVRAKQIIGSQAGTPEMEAALFR
jgi:hypothetical protein